jgi:hypothetical protein
MVSLRDLFLDLYVLLYILTTCQILINNSIPVRFPDDTSVIITNCNPTEFQKDNKDVFGHLNTWFTLNLLSLNSDKTNFIHFKTKNTHSLDIKVKYETDLLLICISPGSLD